MPDLKRHIMGLVDSGPFFFRDSAHYHYASKKTYLLEQMVSFKAEMPSNISKITDARLQVGGTSIDIPIGWGSVMGAQFGGVGLSNSSSLKFTLYDSDDTPVPVLGPTDKISYDAEFKSINPVRDITAFTEVGQEITVSFVDANGDPNCFGLNDTHDVDSRYLVEIYQQSPYLEGGGLDSFSVHSYATGSDTSQNFTIDVPRNSSPLTLSTITTAQAAQNPIPLTVDVSDTDVLDYLRLDDVLWVEYDIVVIKIQRSSDLPLSINAKIGQIFLISDPLDGNYGKYFVLDSSNTFVIKDSVPRINDAKFPMAIEEVPGSPGEIHQGNIVYVKPLNGFDDTDYFDQARIDVELPQALMDYFDGIPPLSIMYTNRTQLVVSDVVNNVLTIQNGPEPTGTGVGVTALPNKYTDIDFVYLPLGIQNFYSSGIKLNSSPKAMLIGQGIDYVEDVKIYIWEMERVIDMPQDFKNTDAPVVITDLLATELDPDETTNIEFKIDSNNTLVINRADNKVVNPTFVRSTLDNAAVPWYFRNVTVESDLSRTKSLLHERSITLTGEAAYIQQHLPGIEADTNYCMSFQGKTTTSARITANIYTFHNKGISLDVDPVILYADNPTLNLNTWWNASDTYILVAPRKYVVDNAEYDFIETISYEIKELTEEFVKYAVRAPRFNDFNKSQHESLEVVSSSTNFAGNVTNIIIEIENTDAGTSSFIDLIQFEVGNNPTEFSHSYDYSIVEYESSSKGYAPRYLVSSLDNRLNNGFTVINIDDVKNTEAVTIQESLSYSVRNRQLVQRDSLTHAKMYGKDRWKRVGLFTTTRRGFLGEYFLFPTIPTLKYLSFIPEPLYVPQSSVLDNSAQSSLYVLAEDPDFKNIPGLPVRISYGFREEEVADERSYVTEDDGSASFSVPKIFQETVSPLMKVDFIYAVVGDAPVGYSPVGSEHYCVISATGKISKVLSWNGTVSSGTEITGEHIPMDTSYVVGSELEYYIPLVQEVGVPVGHIKVGQQTLYDVDLENNGSIMPSFLSGMSNTETSVAVYNRDDSTTITVSKTKTDTYAEFNVNAVSFNPITKSIEIKNSDDSVAVYKRSSSKDLANKQFYFDRQASVIFVNDSALSSIDVTFSTHIAFIKGTNRRDIYFHRYVLFKIIASIYNQINTSSLQTQHENTFPAVLGTISALHPLSFPLFIRMAFNVSIYAKAQHKTKITKSTITYKHNKVLT